VTWADASSSGIASAGHAALFAWEAGADVAASYELGADWSLGVRGSTGYAAGARFKADDRVLAEPAGIYIGAALIVAAAWR
jgi:hypothetical protein